MVRSLKGSSLPLALVVGALIALAAWAALAGPAHAAPNSVAVGDATVAPGGSGTVAVSAEAPADKLGAWDIHVAYDADELQIDGCVEAAVGANFCNAAFADGIVAVVGAATTGATGAFDLATISFTALGADGECTDLTITVNTFADGTPEATETDPTVSNGEVCVEVPATDTPAPTAAPTASPTPAELPDTGGTPTSGSSNTAAYLLGVLGLAVIASGAFVVSRMRRTEI